MHEAGTSRQLTIAQVQAVFLLVDKILYFLHLQIPLQLQLLHGVGVLGTLDVLLVAELPVRCLDCRLLVRSIVDGELVTVCAGHIRVRKAFFSEIVPGVLGVDGPGLHDRLRAICEQIFLLLLLHGLLPQF